MIGVDGVIVTDEMHAAGLRISGDLFDASLKRDMGIFKDVPDLDLGLYMTNRDLVEKYLDNEIDSVQAIYLAMKRVECLTKK